MTCDLQEKRLLKVQTSSRRLFCDPSTNRLRFDCLAAHSHDGRITHHPRHQPSTIIIIRRHHLRQSSAHAPQPAALSAFCRRMIPPRLTTLLAGIRPIRFLSLANHAQTRPSFQSSIATYLSAYPTHNGTCSFFAFCTLFRVCNSPCPSPLACPD